MKIIILLLSLLTFVFASEFQTQKTLTLPTKSIQEFSIDSGSGYLHIEGDAAARQIEVVARIVIKGLSHKNARKFVKDRVELKLEKLNNRAHLVAKIKNDFPGIFTNIANARIDLQVKIPYNLHLAIDDGSGEITIRNTRGKLKIDDGSGSIQISNNEGDVYIDDGSGSITMDRVKGNVKINDGSGAIDCQHITGDVMVDDGSGGMDLRRITGKVVIWDGSGSIKIRKIDGDVYIKEAGSGSVAVSEVKGKVFQKDD